MTNRPTINTLVFAKKQQTQELELRSENLSRLTEESTIVNDTVKANITGGTQTDGKPFIDLEILGGLRLTCQRCLGLFDLQINSHSRFIIASRENELLDVSLEEQDVNTVLAEKELDLVDFVEQELLLALPMVPVHDEGKCESSHLLDTDTNPTNPFKGLR